MSSKLIPIVNFSDEKPNRLKWTVAIVFLVAPFYLNDFIFLRILEKPVLSSWDIGLFYSVDYSFRFLGLLLCYLFFGAAGLRLKSSLPPKEKRDTLIDMVFFPLVIGVIFYFSDLLFKVFCPATWKSTVFFYPSLDGWALYWVDMTFGLLLVAVSEELIFRRHVYAYFSSLLCSSLLGNFAQAILFGIIHWGHGLANVISATVFGLMAGLFYDKKKYLLPVIILHYLVNLVIFA